MLFHATGCVVGLENKMKMNGSLIPRPPPFFVLRFAFSIIHGSGFRALPLPCIILNTNRRTKNGEGLGTRLDEWYTLFVMEILRDLVV